MVTAISKEGVPSSFTIQDGMVDGMLRVASKKKWRDALLYWRQFKADGFDVDSSTFHVWRGHIMMISNATLGDKGRLREIPYGGCIYDWIFSVTNYHSPCLGEVLLQLASGEINSEDGDVVVMDPSMVDVIVMEGEDG